MSPERFEDTARQLHELAKRYHRFSEHPDEFLEAIKSRSMDELQDYKDWSRQFVTKVENGVKQISPVVFLRRILVDRMLSGQEIELADIEVIKGHIDNRNLNFFSDYPDLHEAIANQKERKRSAFTSWNPFTLLFYIDYHFKSEEVKDKLKWIATSLQTELSLSDSDYHLAGFDHNQNFGTDYCWISLYPSEAGDHKISYALSFSAKPDGFGYGIVAGDNVEDGKYLDEFSSPDEFDPESTLDFYRSQTPVYYRLNQELLQASEKEQSVQKESAKRHPLNLILYGPPGTGKTYSVQRRALAIIEGSTKGVGDDTISQRFQDYMDEGRIEFTTFHPSYSYEEFVEGFRYDPDAKVPVLRSGIFKQTVRRAVNPYPSQQSRDGARIWKISLGGAGDEHIYDRCIAHSEIAIGWWPDEDLSGMGKEDIRHIFKAHGSEDETNNIRSVHYFVNEVQDGDYVAVLKDQRSIRAIGVVRGPYEHKADTYDEYTHVRPVEWIDKRDHSIYAMNGSKNIGMPTLYPLDRIALQDFVELLPEPSKRDKAPYILIIDEINRGNLSRIFGELITLLEPDKRKGASNELSARLPYSQERFTIPPNLYVIGTMNTADRSIALLDVALRRRFTFEEMMPDVQVIREQLSATLDEEDTDVELSAEQVELISDVFEVMNRRISILLDRDHQIGHSYFLDVQSMTDLHRVLYGRVFPLLQEYFYNDFNRLVNLVGKHQTNQKTGFIEVEADGYDTTFANERSHQPLWTFHRYQSGELEDALRNTFLMS